MILRQRLPTIHEDVVFEKTQVAGHYKTRAVPGLKKGRRSAGAKHRRTIQSSSRSNIEDFYRKSAELANKNCAVGLGSSLPCEFHTSLSSERGNTLVEVKSKGVTPKSVGGQNGQQLRVQKNLANVRPIINDVDAEKNNQTADHEVKKPTLHFAPDINKKEMSDAEYKAKLRQQYQANLEKFAEKEIAKEKAKEMKTASAHVATEEENIKPVVSVEVEKIEKNVEQDVKIMSKKEALFQSGEEKEKKSDKKIKTQEIVYRIVGFGSVDHVSRNHKDRGTDAKKTQTHYTPHCVVNTQSVLKDRRLEQGLLSFKQSPVISKNVLSVDKRDPVSQQKQSTGIKTQQTTCSLPSIRPGPKKVSWADPHPRQPCTDIPVPRGGKRTCPPTNPTTQRTPPTPKAFLTAIPNNTAQIKRFFHAPYQHANNKLHTR